MIKHRGFAVSTLTIFAFVSIIALANAVESQSAREKMEKLKDLPIEKVFERLKETDYFVNEELLHEAVVTAFEHRRTKAIAYCLNHVRLLKRETIDKKLQNRHADFYVAKKIFQAFPTNAVNPLLKLYENEDVVTKGNVIRAIGGLAILPPVKKMLIEALDDKSFCEEEYPEMLGEPLRICDVAYNQLVLQYKVKNVLRTLSTAHRIEVRNYHINILKSHL